MNTTQNQFYATIVFFVLPKVTRSSMKHAEVIVAFATATMFTRTLLNARNAVHCLYCCVPY